MPYNLFIDDERYPPRDNKDWVIVRSSAEAIKYAEEYGLPSFISFDHDLGGDDTSVKFIHWMINQCLDSNTVVFPASYTIHSQNPIGTENMRGLMDGFIQFQLG